MAKKTHETIACKHEYPILHGAKEQPSSKADATGLSQQFIDRGLQKEIGLHRTANVSPFTWRLTFYVHPGMRREIDIDAKDLPDLVDYLHALAVGVGPNRIAAWCRFHTFGAMGYFANGREVVRYLKCNEFFLVDRREEHRPLRHHRLYAQRRGLDAGQMIYLIRRTDFDALENHLPLTAKIVGYCDTREQAQQKVEEMFGQSKKYEGYDRRIYPEFWIVEVSRL